jgi:hypothetical protein
LERVCLYRQSSWPSYWTVVRWFYYGQCELAMVWPHSFPFSCFIFTNPNRSLLYSVPLNALILLFIWRNMPYPALLKEPYDEGDKEELSSFKFRRVDLLGVITLGLANCSFLLFFDQAQRNMDILHNLFAVIPAGTWIIFLAAFIGIEAYYAHEPIFPLRLMMKRNVISSYAIQFLQTTAQVAVSIYQFQRLLLLLTSVCSSTRLFHYISVSRKATYQQ